jgi:hypothetical protein
MDGIGGAVEPVAIPMVGAGVPALIALLLLAGIVLMVARRRRRG